MAAGTFPLFGGSPNPRPVFSNFSTPGRYPDAILRMGVGVGAATPTTQTAQQLADWNQANKDWEAIEAARKKRQEAFEAMAQKAGDVPAAYKSRAGKREAGDPLTPVQVAGGLAPSDPRARYGRPKKWPYLQSIVNMGTLA